MIYYISYILYPYILSPLYYLSMVYWHYILYDIILFLYPPHHILYPCLYPVSYTPYPISYTLYIVCTISPYPLSIKHEATPTMICTDKTYFISLLRNNLERYRHLILVRYRWVTLLRNTQKKSEGASHSCLIQGRLHC
jgi:hypothetical protein